LQKTGKIEREIIVILVFLNRYKGIIKLRGWDDKECGEHGTDEIFVQYYGQ
jgi:hypothetical protein